MNNTEIKIYRKIHNILCSTSWLKRRGAMYKLKKLQFYHMELIMLGLTDEVEAVRTVAKELLNKDVIEQMINELHSHSNYLYRVLEVAEYHPVIEMVEPIISLLSNNRNDERAARLFNIYDDEVTSSVLCTLNNYKLSQAQIIKIINITTYKRLGYSSLRHLLYKMGLLSIISAVKCYVATKNEFAIHFLNWCSPDYMYLNRYSLSVNDYQFLMKNIALLPQDSRFTLVKIYCEVQDDLNLPPLEDCL